MENKTESLTDRLFDRLIPYRAEARRWRESSLFAHEQIIELLNQKSRLLQERDTARRQFDETLRQNHQLQNAKAMLNADGSPKTLPHRKFKHRKQLELKHQNPNHHE